MNTSKIGALALGLLFAIAGNTVQTTSSIASTINGTSTSGLVAPTVIDFGANLYPIFTPITNQFPGVVFGSNFSYETTACCIGSPQSGYLQSEGAAPDKIQFVQPVTAAAFTWYTFPGSTTFTAYLNGSLVESYSPATTNVNHDFRFYGFFDIYFDEIRISISAQNGAFNLDDLQFNQATPIPAALPLFAGGLGVIGLLARRRKRKATAIAV